MDVFIANMANETVQRKLTTEPKENPEEVLRFAEAYEEGIVVFRLMGIVCHISNSRRHVVFGLMSITVSHRSCRRAMFCLMTAGAVMWIVRNHVR